MSTLHKQVSREKLHQEFDTIVADTETLLASMANATGDKALALRADVEKGLASARDRLTGLRKASVAQASQAIHATDDYVHAHPWRAVGIVAGVGALAGLVTGLMVNRRGHANGAASTSVR
ncbi:MAG: DUF883 domain-containing protein [Betaproteobacteria bacterium]|nr:DUF883 domain-containing protein [Betaproteobacteria bacterium]